MFDKIILYCLFFAGLTFYILPMKRKCQDEPYKKDEAQKIEGSQKLELSWNDIPKEVWNDVMQLKKQMIWNNRKLLLTLFNELGSKCFNANGQRCLQKIIGHKDVVTSVAVLANGNIVSASDDRAIKIWNVTNGYQLLQTLTGHTGVVSSVAVLANGNIISGSWDETVKIWDAGNGYKVLKTIIGHKGVVTSVAVLPNGNIVSGSADKTVQIYDTQGFLNCFNALSLRQIDLIIKLQTQRLNKKKRVLSRDYKVHFNNLPGMIKKIFSDSVFQN